MTMKILSCDQVVRKSENYRTSNVDFSDAIPSESTGVST